MLSEPGIEPETTEILESWVGCRYQFDCLFLGPRTMGMWIRWWSCPTSGRVVLPSKPVDESSNVQSPCSLKLVLIQARILQNDLQGEHSPRRNRSHMQQHSLNLTTQPNPWFSFLGIVARNLNQFQRKTTVYYKPLLRQARPEIDPGWKKRKI